MLSQGCQVDRAWAMVLRHLCQDIVWLKNLHQGRHHPSQLWMCKVRQGKVVEESEACNVQLWVPDGGYQFQYLDGVFLAGRGERRVCFYEDPQYYPSLCFHSLLPLPMMPAPNPIDNFLWLKLSTLLDLIDHSHILEIFSSLGFFFTDFFSHSSDQPPQICLHLGHLPKLQSHIFRCQFHFFSRIV